MGDKINVLIPEEDVKRRIAEIGAQISADFDGQEVFLVVILKGAAFFGCELARCITCPTTIDFMATSSYGSETSSSGDVKIKKDLDLSVENKNVIIVEDIIDSGNTLSFLSELFSNRKAKSVSLCALLDKPDRREVDVKMDYIGFSIPNEFVVGYGLDYAQKYRNLPYVGVVKIS